MTDMRLSERNLVFFHAQMRANKKLITAGDAARDIGTTGRCGTLYEKALLKSGERSRIYFEFGTIVSVMTKKNNNNTFQ